MNATIIGRFIGHRRRRLNAAKCIALQLLQRWRSGPRYVSACEVNSIRLYELKLSRLCYNVKKTLGLVSTKTCELSERGVFSYMIG